jgi:hypothetical protein
MIVAVSLDDSTARIIAYLSECDIAMCPLPDLYARHQASTFVVSERRGKADNLFEENSHHSLRREKVEKAVRRDGRCYVKPRALLSWSSGKDSAWSLHVLRQRNEVEDVG